MQHPGQLGVGARGSILERLTAPRGRLLPRGALDLVLQLLLIGLAYTAWRYARGAVNGDTAAEAAAAFAHARDLISAERSLNLLFEQHGVPTFPRDGEGAFTDGRR